jgi:putative flippase GtrA
MSTTIGRVSRFSVVGVFNTLFNFLVLNFCYYKLGVNKIVANIIATSLALLISFVLNRKFVFAHKGNWRHQFMLFALITVAGSLILNNSIYAASVFLLKSASVGISHALNSIVNLQPTFILINGSAIIATLFSMVWNYNWYHRVVFRGGGDAAKTLED